eukprot:TRINITY_DN3796_c0_g2_i1.p1 TRINITY_DN3796_c0_g2~~TRINITY_DN3796_c0_g2_i1.p1  ORF type:complete len:325 (-),score=65.17 TRINITY_DN3796_c0_g2_i1:55-1029(-)
MCMKYPETERVWQRANLLGVITNLTYGHEDNQTVVKDIPTAASSIVAHLNPEMKRAVLENALTATYCLCVNNLELSVQFIQYDIGDKLIKLVCHEEHRRNPLILHHALALLAYLTELQHPNLLVQFDTTANASGFQGGLGMLIWRIEYGTYHDSDDGEEEQQLSEADRRKFRQLKMKILKNCAKLVRLYAQLQLTSSRAYFRSNDDAMQAVVGVMKFEEEGLLLELLIAVCLLASGDFELQRLFRKSGGITRLVGFMSSKTISVVVKEMSSKTIQVITEQNKPNQSFIATKREQAKEQFNRSPMLEVPTILSQFTVSSPSLFRK